MSVVVKTKLGDDIRRFTLTTGSFKSLLEQLRAIYPGQELAMRYTDDEGDDVSITHPDEFDEALRIARSLNPPILRIALFSSSPQTTVPTTAAPTTAAAMATSPRRLLSPPLSAEGAMKTLDAIQEKIVANLSELRSLSASFEARKAAAAAAAAAVVSATTPTLTASADRPTATTTTAAVPIAESCTQLSRQIAEQCVNLSRALPLYTQSVSDEIAAQCAALASEVVAAGNAASAQTASDSAAEERQTSSDCKDSSRAAADMAQFTPPPHESAAEITRQIEGTCAALAAETRAKCMEISEGISKMVQNL